MFKTTQKLHNNVPTISKLELSYHVDNLKYTVELENCSICIFSLMNHIIFWAINKFDLYFPRFCQIKFFLYIFAYLWYLELFCFFKIPNSR